MTTDKTPATLAVDVLARKVFEKYSLASGNPPDAHFDRNAAEQWMAHALEFAGVAELIEAMAALVDHTIGCEILLKVEFTDTLVNARSALARVKGESA